MLINSEEINNILKISDEKITVAGKKYFEHEKIKISYFKKASNDTYIAKCIVEGSYIYDVKIIKKDKKLYHNCNCPHKNKYITPCKHIIAMYFDLYINSKKYLDFEKNGGILEEDKINSDKINVGKANLDKINVNKSSFFSKLYEPEEDIYIKSKYITYYENLELDFKKEFENVEIIPDLIIFSGNCLNVGFSIFKDKSYKLNDLYEFVENIREKKKFKYGRKLEFKHDIAVFNDSSKHTIAFIEKSMLEYKSYAEITNSFGILKEHKRLIRLKYGLLDDFFELMEDKEIEINCYPFKKIKFVKEDPKLSFEVKKQGNGFVVNKLENCYFFEGKNGIYVIFKDKLYKCSEEYNSKLAMFFKEFNVSRRMDLVDVREEELTSFCEYIVPNLKKFTNLKIDDELIKKYAAKNLEVKVFLDKGVRNSVIAKVKFCYGDVEFNPFDEKVEVKYNRNLVAESKVKEFFKDCNFVIDYIDKDMYIKKDSHIYKFLTEYIVVFVEKFEVLVTEAFKKIQTIKSKNIDISIGLENGLLEVDIAGFDLSENELKEILAKYEISKKYFRLTDGSYINLESKGMVALKDLVKNLGVLPQDIVNNNIKLPKYRAVNLEELLKDGDGLVVKKDRTFNNIVKNITETKDTKFEVPNEFKNVLRQYQKTGFNWIKTLEKYGLGGILADDMGLGKTIQIIAILLDEKKNSNKKSIVICPSSLCINWQKEINRFAPNLNVLIISGGLSKRLEMIKDIKKYDVVLTSYDLLKRDVKAYDGYKFKYVIIDEAQYIKNSKTKCSKSIKEINGEVKIALTGTPIENSLLELWSIFDFVMPGFLFAHKDFKKKFENIILKEEDEILSIEAKEKLRKMVSPFILRRIKKDVLKELPEKTESIMYNQMEEVQEKLYKAYFNDAKKKIQEKTDKNEISKSKIEILSIITRLRQICCHPSLFIDNYDGESAKFNQCIELIEEAVSGGHKILVFSQFTSIFNMIIKELEKLNISYDILTGKTKISERVQKVEEFNKNKDISVFLISLKAGGTGLNLTGADMVIHYDPWWNLSAENQATDRAHRIGQKNNVQVFKLITNNTIEEKIKLLQDKKMDLTNSVIQEGETFINKMSKDEILELFEN